MIRAKDNKYFLRLEICKFARTSGIRAAARHFACARNTVRLWLRRFEQQGPAGLKELSRAPKTCPHKTSPHHEKKVLEARRQSNFGPQRLKEDFGLKPSLGAISRIIRQHGLAKKRRKKSQKKNDLRKIKARYKAFERVQADTKPLFDIANYWPQMKRLKLPLHQYTHRDVKSGALFIDYGNELSATYACLASKRILQHLKKWNVSLEQIILSTDNGSEFGGTERQERDRGYHALIQNFLANHRFLPPATPNAHADVESSHHFIEAEFFDLETFRHRADFFEKARTYQRWWNFARANYSKEGKTPAQILEEQGINPACLLLPPADLDSMFRHSHGPPQVGQNLPVAPEIVLLLCFYWPFSGDDKRPGCSKRALSSDPDQRPPENLKNPCAAIVSRKNRRQR